MIFVLFSGHAFDVIHSASGGSLNLIDPPRRDVVATTDIISFPFASALGTITLARGSCIAIFTSIWVRPASENLTAPNI